MTLLAGLAVAVESAALIVLASPTKPTVGCWATTTWPAPGLIVAVRVFVSAVVEASVPVATPLASVTTEGCVNVLFVPVEASCTVWPATALPFASLTVMVIVEVAEPLATTLVEGLAVALVFAALIVLGSPTKPTVGCPATTTWPAPGLIVAVSVFVCAVVDAIVPVATPLASVTATGCVTELFAPVEASCTVCPATALPFASLTVTVIVEIDAPLATTLLVGLAVAVESAALIVLGSATKPTVGC